MSKATKETKAKAAEAGTDEAGKSRQSLVAAIIALSKDSAKMGNAIHALVVDIAKHAETYRDATPAAILYESLHRSQRPKAIAKWFETYTGIRILDRKGEQVKAKLKPDATWNIEAGQNDPYFNLDEAKVGRPQGEIDAVSLLSKKLEALEEKILLWDQADEPGKLAIFKAGFDPRNVAEELRRDIAILQRAHAA